MSDSTQPDALTAALHTLELRLLDPRQRQTGELVELLAPSFLEIGRSGRVYTRDTALAALQTEQAPSLTLTQFVARRLTDDAALVTYRSCTQADPPECALRSSVWLRERGAWRIVFHQATPCTQNVLQVQQPNPQEPLCPPMTSPN